MTKPVKMTLPQEVAEWLATLGAQTTSAAAAQVVVQAYEQVTGNTPALNTWGGDRKSNEDQAMFDIIYSNERKEWRIAKGGNLTKPQAYFLLASYKALANEPAVNVLQFR
jgi:hypothetical protein